MLQAYSNLINLYRSGPEAEVYSWSSHEVPLFQGPQLAPNKAFRSLFYVAFCLFHMIPGQIDFAHVTSISSRGPSLVKPEHGPNASLLWLEHAGILMRSPGLGRQFERWSVPHLAVVQNCRTCRYAGEVSNGWKCVSIISQDNRNLRNEFTNKQLVV